MKQQLLLYLALWPVLTLSAATYFCSPDGQDDGSSIERPTTFTAGLKLLKNPGDTLYLLSGQYDLGNTVIQNLNGASTKRIVIAGWEGINRSGKYATVLDFRETPYGTRGLQLKNTTSFLHLKNLTLRYSGKNNLYNEGSYNLFENMDIYGSADSGCQMKVGGNNIIKNVDSHDNFDYKNMSGDVADFGGNADGFADKQFTGAGNHYIGCRAWNNSDDGWDFFQRVSNSQTVIEHCICFQNGQPYYDMRNNPRAKGVDRDWFESMVGTSMTDRYGQTITITMEKYPCQGNGNGFKMGGGYTNHQILMHHCLSVGNYARGFDQNNNDGTMRLYNNTGYDNAYNYGFTTRYGTLYIRNCVSFKSQKGDSYKAKTVATDDHNTWNNGFSCSEADFQSLDTTQIRMYRTANGDLSQITFMHLTEGSNLIDAGIDVNVGYNGEAPDLGCYESPGEEHKPEPEDTIPATQPEGTHSVAFVTIPYSAEDKPLLQYLKTNDSLWVVETDVTDPSVDYSGYEVIVLGSKPTSSAAGFTPLKGYDCPTVLLKPFLLKPTVWNWGNAVNTQDLAISVTAPEHPVFRGLTQTDGQLQLFSQCNTNAVTGISEWYNTSDILPLAAPVSQPATMSVAELPAGTDCNGTILPQRMLMIGLSEYSTVYLTDQGKQLVLNAILYQLGIEPSSKTDDTTSPRQQVSETRKILQEGQIYILRNNLRYTPAGIRVPADR
ncbi:MAG: hypothetical protein II551_04530 [Paludibacteraceae bacterium]|nr:hypothetical protein [Paludibacteraceae bacterium]